MYIHANAQTLLQPMYIIIIIIITKSNALLWKGGPASVPWDSFCLV
jgi:hypothetical protein